MVRGRPGGRGLTRRPLLATGLLLVFLLAACGQARENPPPSRSVGPRAGRVADGEKGRLQLSTGPTAPAASAERSCAALPPLETQLAQLLLVGFPGTTAGPVSRRLVDRGVGGLLLFRANVVSGPQVRELVAELQDRAEIPLEVAVDQEPGTRVARLAGIVRASPPARPLGRLPNEPVRR